MSPLRIAPADSRRLGSRPWNVNVTNAVDETITRCSHVADLMAYGCAVNAICYRRDNVRLQVWLAVYNIVHVNNDVKVPEIANAVIGLNVIIFFVKEKVLGFLCRRTIRGTSHVINIYTLSAAKGHVRPESTIGPPESTRGRPKFGIHNHCWPGRSQKDRSISDPIPVGVFLLRVHRYSVFTSGQFRFPPLKR